MYCSAPGDGIYTSQLDTQCVAVCCSVLQCVVAVCCSQLLQCVAVYRSALEYALSLGAPTVHVCVYVSINVFVCLQESAREQEREYALSLGAPTVYLCVYVCACKRARESA